ncbi:MAG: hypothetical protein WC002_01230 [Candidatus Muiribacteriota bacterium]
MFVKKTIIFAFLIIFFLSSNAQNEIIGRVTFIKGNPVLVNQTGQIHHLRPELEFTNHSHFKVEPDSRVEVFLNDWMLLKADGHTEFLLRKVGDEVQVILEFGNIWVKSINKTVIRWKNFQVKTDLGIFTAETLVNDVFRISCLDGELSILKDTEVEDTVYTGERIFIGRKDSVDKVKFGIEAENIKWAEFRKIRQGADGKTAVFTDGDFVLPPGQEEELLSIIPKKEIKKTDHRINIDFISPRRNQVNIGKKLRVAGRVNTVMVNHIEVYLDDSFLGNVKVENFMFDYSFNVKNPERARFLDCVTRDVYGNKAVFTVKLIPDTTPPVITVVPPFNTRKTQIFKGFVEDRNIEQVKVVLNKGSIFEEVFNVNCKNGYFEFKMSVDDKQHDSIPVRYGANSFEISAVDEFGNVGVIKSSFFIDKALTDTFFNK